MKKIWRKVILFLMLTTGIAGSGMTASAALNININVDGKKITHLLGGYLTYNCDLNKDGRKETIKCSYNKNGKDILYLNGKQVLAATSKNSYGYWIYDLNKKDRYLEIYGKSKLAGKSVFYRYNGKKLVAIAAGLYGDGKVFKSMPVETSYWTSQPGDGTYYAYVALGGFTASQGYGGYVPIKLRCRIVNKKMVVWPGADHEMVMRTTILFGITNFSIAPQANGYLIAYDKPALSGVRRLFTLKKGDKYTYLKVRFSSPYSFIQIKDQKTGRVGWVGVRTSQMKLASDVERK